MRVDYVNAELLISPSNTATEETLLRIVHVAKAASKLVLICCIWVKILECTGEVQAHVELRIREALSATGGRVGGHCRYGCSGPYCGEVSLGEARRLHTNLRLSHLGLSDFRLRCRFLRSRRS